VAWVRVLAGIAVAVSGAIWTKFILKLVLDAGHGTLKLDSQLQAQLVTWEIFALGMLAGGGLAGATTRNGLKQGLVVGIGTSAALVCFHLVNQTAFLEQLLLTVGSTMSLTVAGAWFGGELFPPILQRPRKVGGPVY
jgi:hypothetical protein